MEQHITAGCSYFGLRKGNFSLCVSQAVCCAKTMFFQQKLDILPPKSKWLKFLSGLFLGGLLSVTPVAAQVEFKAEVSSNTVSAGSVLELKLQLLGSSEGTLEPIKLGGFRQTGTVEEVMGAQIVGGKGRTHRSWTFRLKAPERAGTYTLPTQEVRHKGQSYRSLPVKVVVEPAATSADALQSIPKGADPNLFVATTVNHSTAYTGQQLIVEVKIYTRLNVDGYDIISVPKVSSGFLQELKRFPRKAGTSRVQGREYASQTIYAAALYPNREGKLRIEPMHINVRTEDPANPYGVALVKVSSQVLNINVKAAPEPRPDAFTGGVGNYQFNWLAPENDTIRVGEAFTVQFSLEGNGNGRFATIPPFEIPEGLQLFEPRVIREDELDAGEYFLHSKTVEYTIQAQRAGTFTLQPQLHWFDPDSNQYRSWQPAVPCNLVVEGDTTVIATTPAKAPTSTPSEHTAPTASWWTSERIMGATALGMALLMTLGLLVWLLRKRTLQPVSMTSAHTVHQPIVQAAPPYRAYKATVPTPDQPVQSVATPVVYQRLEQLANRDNTEEEFYRVIQQLIREKIAALLQQAAPTITHRHVAEAFEKGFLQPNQHMAAQQLLSQCELALYGGQNLWSQRMAMLSMARQIL
jgi:BatD DUF11 like domain